MLFCRGDITARKKKRGRSFMNNNFFFVKIGDKFVLRKEEKKKTENEKQIL